MAAFAQSPEAPAKVQDMLRHAEAAHTLDRALTEASFQVAKAHMALGAPDQALPSLRAAIDDDPGFAIRAAEDPDHKRHDQRLQGFFAALREEKLRALASAASTTLGAIAPWLTASPRLAQVPQVARLGRLMDPGSWGLVDVLRYAADGYRDDDTFTAGLAAGLTREADQPHGPHVRLAPSGPRRLVGPHRVQRPGCETRLPSARQPRRQLRLPPGQVATVRPRARPSTLEPVTLGARRASVGGSDWTMRSRPLRPPRHGPPPWAVDCARVKGHW